MKKIDQLKQWIRYHRVFCYSELQRYWSSHGFGSAERRVRDLVREHFLQKMDKGEIRQKGLTDKVAWFKYTGDDGFYLYNNDQMEMMLS